MTQDLAPSRNFCSPSYPLLEGDALLPALTPADLLAPHALHTPGIPGMMKECFPQAPHVCRAWTSHGGRGLQPLPWASSTGPRSCWERTAGDTGQLWPRGRAPHLGVLLQVPFQRDAQGSHLTEVDHLAPVLPDVVDQHHPTPVAKVGSWHGTVCPRCSHCHNASTKHGFELTEPAARPGQPLTACPESHWLCSTAGLGQCGIFFLILAVLQQSRCFAYNGATSCPAWRSYQVVLCNAPGSPVKPSALGPCRHQPRDVPGAGGESGLGLLLTRSRVYRGKCSISAGAGIDPGCCELLAPRTGAQSPTVTFQLSQACGWDCPGSCYHRHRISLTGGSVPCCHVGLFQWLQPVGRSMSLWSCML